MELVKEKIGQRRGTVGVIGMGYVGLPLAVEIAEAGFTTVGIDVTEEKVASLNRGVSYIQDIPTDRLKPLVDTKKLWAATEYSTLQECDVVIICVPTPLAKGKNPDVSFIVSAVSEIKNHMRKDQLVILESTTYPGTTEELVLPLLEETGLKVGEDFYLAFSPERIDPGNSTYGLKNTPKVVGGVTSQCTEISQAFYSQFVDQVIPVGSPKTAEMVKLFENLFRAVNIGLVNEIAIMCDRFNVDTWEVIDAAASKPFGIMPFYPGPGLGGHCIPVDPHYLMWKMRLMDYNPRFIQLADEINSSMPRFVVEKISDALNGYEKSVNGSKVLVLGVAYKRDIDDYRESPALDVIELLQSKGATVSYHDPYVPVLRAGSIDLVSCDLNNAIQEHDCVAVITDHTCFDMPHIVEESQLLIDARNATKGIRGHSEKIVKI